MISLPSHFHHRMNGFIKLEYFPFMAFFAQLSCKTCLQLATLFLTSNHQCSIASNIYCEQAPLYVSRYCMGFAANVNNLARTSKLKIPVAISIFTTSTATRSSVQDHILMSWVPYHPPSPPPTDSYQPPASQYPQRSHFPGSQKR